MICNLAGCVWARPHATKQVCHQVFAVHILSSYLVVVRGAVVSFAWADQNSGNTTFFAVCSCQRPTSLCFRHTKAVPECSIMQCFAGYRRCQSIQGKQGQSGNNRPAVPPDTSMLSPELHSNGMLRETCTWVQSRSSQPSASRLCGSAISVQLGSRISGQQLCPVEHNEALSAHIAATGWFANTTPLLL